jgi:hypothetical protein
MKLGMFWDVLPCSYIRAMFEASRTSETSVYIQLRTWKYIPEDSELHNTKSDHKTFERVV